MALSSNEVMGYYGNLNSFETSDINWAGLTVPSVCPDTDGDGIPDNLDTDADGDGCADAKEAGFTDANDDGQVDGTGVDTDGKVTGGDGYTTPADTDNSGTADHLESGVDEACNPSIDTDGDGVPDETDLDDDNDGILDADEGCSNGSLSNVTGVTQEGPIANQTGTNWMNQGQRGFLSIDETVSPGERITFPTTFITDLIETASTAQYEWYMGLEDANFDVSSYNLGYPNDMWEGGVYVKFTYTQQTVYATLYGGNYSHAATINSTAVASSNSRFFFEISNSGDEIRAGFSQTSTGDVLASTAYVDWSNKKVTSLDTSLGLTSPVKFLLYVQAVFNNTPAIDTADIDWTALSIKSASTAGCSGLDTDNDGTPDHLDTDADGDGCPDAEEAGFTDANNDGEVDGTGVDANGLVTGGDGYTAPADTDSSGTADHLEAGVAECNPDTDGDGIPDETDLDDDNDGIYDTAEGDDTIDTDGDGIPNYLDTDSDGDGCSDAKEAGYTDADDDGMVDGASTTFFYAESPIGTFHYPLFTTQAEANFEDLKNGGTGTSHTHTYAEDTTNTTWYMPDTGNHMASAMLPVNANGITYNSIENINANPTTSTQINANGTVSGSDGYAYPSDADNNGVLDHLDASFAQACFEDNDGDGVEDSVDLDDDNDGILDTDEGDDSVDTDGDGIPDNKDTDSDGDGCSDAKEAGFTDANNDGEVDGTGIATDGTVTGSDGYNTPADADNSGTADHLEDTYSAACGIDSDGDGVEDSVDLDDDNDGILDTSEGDDTVDTDGDGTPDYLDTDSDGDGCTDAKEAGYTDANNDGAVDGTGVNADGTVAGSDGYVYPRDTDNNGIFDHLDPNYAVVCQDDADGDGIEDSVDLDDDNDGIFDTAEGDDTIDTDGDGTPDYLDSDSDGDGCNDAKEAGYTDADNDGEVDGSGYNTNGTVAGSDGYGTPADVDNNGIADHLDSAYSIACDGDHDGDGIDDATDLDDDNDGIYDTAEGDDTVDTDGDGTPDYLDLDSDGDGCNDAKEVVTPMLITMVLLMALVITTTVLWLIVTVMPCL